MTLHLDFETRSDVSLKDAGVYAYATHPSTQVLCMAWAHDAGPVQVTYDAILIKSLLTVIAVDDTISAFNAGFERLIAKHVLGIDIPIERFVCTAAQARSNAYPGNLDDCARALGLEQQKDAAGYALMLRVSNAKNPAPTPDELRLLADYCKQDVVVEREIAKRTRPLWPEELKDYWLNEKINDRGVLVDLSFCRAATRYAEAERSELNTKIDAASLGVIQKVTQTKKIAEYLGLTTVAHDDLEVLLDRGDATLTDLQTEIVELRLAGSNTTTAKFAKLDLMASADARLRGMFMFAGAGQTGRYSSRGAQVHNLPRDVPELYEQAIRDIEAGIEPTMFKLIYGDIIYNLSRLVRPALLAPPGKTLLIGDFASVEARGLPWLANARTEVQAYASGRDRYVEDAAHIFDRFYGFDPKVGGQTPAMFRFHRQIGKVARLSLGFGGGVGAFKKMARNYGVHVDEALALLIVTNWRRANPWATAFWNELSNAAVRAVRHPGTAQCAGKVSYLARADTLWCRLPSGRVLAYPQVALDMVDGAFGPQFELSALKAQWKPKRGERQWPRVTLWHGLLAENVTQAMCNDLLRFAMRNLDAAGYDIVTHTHDEVASEADAGTGVEQYKSILEQRPPWASDFPLVAEVHSSRRYVK